MDTPVEIETSFNVLKNLNGNIKPRIEELLKRRHSLVTEVHEINEELSTLYTLDLLRHEQL